MSIEDKSVLVPQDREMILLFQRSEITEHFIYRELAKVASGKNREVLLKISDDELTHYNVWREYTGEDVKPDQKKILFYSLLARLLGLSFTAKLMERGENLAEKRYREQIKNFKVAESILRDEIVHENLLLSMIEERRVEYIGSMVLGLNDALVELSGTLAGLTFALQNSRLVGLAGVITGIAAALSMSSAEYLSQRSEVREGKNPLLAALFTGLSYIITVVILVFPYLILENYILSLVWSIFNGVLAVIVFGVFVSVVKDKSFKEITLEMLGINLSVILISFLVGLLARKILGVDIG